VATPGRFWGADVFGPEYIQPAGNYPQYDSVGKVRVDPNNSNNIVAGTKKGLWFSYDQGVTWTNCLTNGFTSQRQDITGLELTDMGGGVTRIIAAVGVRGFPTYVQYDLGLNGANGIYKGTIPASGCPADFTSIASNANGFVFGTAVAGSPYSTGALMNAGSGVPCNYPLSGGTATYCGGANGGTVNNLGRIDIAVAPSNPNVIYAQVGSIDWNSTSGCGTTTGCQLGAWASADGGATWQFMVGSAGGSLTACTGTAGGGDYPQNWYDQGIVVDPNNADRVFFDTFEIWLANRTGSSWYDLTCGYNGTPVANHVVHVDQHALAFVKNSSDILLVGNDGGTHYTLNASAAVIGTTRPTWVNNDAGLNTIEFYSGDISGNFATSASPSAVGGAQDNGPSSAMFSGSPTQAVQWQMGLGGDGFSGLIDPMGTGSSLRYWQGNNSGGFRRCVSNCTSPGATWTSWGGSWTTDTQSFVLPVHLFHGGIAGGDDCQPAGSTTGCGHLLAGTTRVWESVTGASASTHTWYVTNNPITANLTKGTLGNRSYINQVKYSPKYQSVAIVATNDGNVQIGFNLGTGTQAQASWVDVTGGNAILPNRPIMGIALDPSAPAVGTPTGYAAVGGFNNNSPGTPGHVFQVVCTMTTTPCDGFTWTDKTGNLPDIPVDSVIVNPNFTQQVFAGSDFGLYYTDDITANPPVWFRFNNGLPNVMIWDMSVDRGATTLALWTRSRGAYAWPLPTGPAGITAPPKNSTLSGTTVTFTWTAEATASAYQIWVGSTPGGNDYGYCGTSGLSCTASGLPSNGSAVYATLWGLIGGTWTSLDTAQYTAANVTNSQITSPPKNSQLSGSSATFTWTAETNAAGYQLWAGTTPGANDLGYCGTSNLTCTLNNLPTNGQPVYVTLWGYAGGTWSVQDTAQYTAANTTKAQILTPPKNSMWTSGTVTFTWSPESNGTSYQLWIGSTPGAYDIAYSGTSDTTLTFGGLPTNGQTAYVTLWGYDGSSWAVQDTAQYTEAGGMKPTKK
jgi:hypothetical protein